MGIGLRRANFDFDCWLSFASRMSRKMLGLDKYEEEKRREREAASKSWMKSGLLLGAAAAAAAVGAAVAAAKWRIWV